MERDILLKIVDKLKKIEFDKIKNIVEKVTLEQVTTNENGIYVSDINASDVISATYGSASQTFVLVRPSTGGKAVFFVFTDSFVPVASQTIDIVVWKYNEP